LPGGVHVKRFLFVKLYQGVDKTTEQKEIFALLVENIRLFDRIITNTDELNKRLVTAFIVAMLAFSFTIMGTAWLYFKTDYQYPEPPAVTQTQSNNQNVNDNKNGGNE